MTPTGMRELNTMTREELVQQVLREQAIVADLTEDAERWRALMSSARMHFMGSAGFDHVPKDGNYENLAMSNQTPRPRGDREMHFGMEFWDRYSPHEHARFPDSFERELLTVYVDSIRAALAEAGSTE